MGFQPTKFDTEIIYDGYLGETISPEIYKTEIDNSFFGGAVLYKTFNQKNDSDNVFLYNMDVIVQSIMNMVFTSTGERLFRPTFGASLNFVLFSAINDATSFKIKQILINTIESWDPRIVVDRVKSKVMANVEAGGYDLYMVYNVRISGETFVLSAFYKIYESD